jgi:hypothetical protein
VRRADDYLRAYLGEPLSLLELCRELGVSERTLHYAFQQVRGLSPMAYLRALRLNAVRQELKAAPDTAKVQAIAQRWGFWHPGSSRRRTGGCSASCPPRRATGSRGAASGKVTAHSAERREGAGRPLRCATSVSYRLPRTERPFSRSFPEGRPLKPRRRHNESG